MDSDFYAKENIPASLGKYFVIFSIVISSCGFFIHQKGNYIVILRIKVGLFVKWTILLLAVICGCSAVLTAGQKIWHEEEITYPATDLIRLHVVANSDSPVDQHLKNMVRDEVIENLSPLLLQANDTAEARIIAKTQLPQIAAVAKKTIQTAGLDYPVTVQLDRFLFPTKHYGTFILPTGEYESVQITLGVGNGSNWWCVLFPPLCFVELPRRATEPQNYYNNTRSLQPEEEQIQIEFKWRVLEVRGSKFEARGRGGILPLAGDH
jgi:stage II sporulation protein R